jgi:REP element-mobilizing transposase RayT
MAGRLPRGRRAHAEGGVRPQGHHPRPELAARFPVHVTMRRVADGPALRRGDCYAVLRRCFAAGKSRFGFRLVHYSVQGNHIHLICEADDRRALSRGMQGLTIRVARRLNRRLGRRGKLFAQRYHARILRTPREVRHALIYVLNNRRHHAEERALAQLDRPLLLGPWFTGWRRTIRLHWAKPHGDPPVVQRDLAPRARLAAEARPAPFRRSPRGRSGQLLIAACWTRPLRRGLP